MHVQLHVAGGGGGRRGGGGGGGSKGGGRSNGGGRRKTRGLAQCFCDGVGTFGVDGGFDFQMVLQSPVAREKKEKGEKGEKGKKGKVPLVCRVAVGEVTDTF